MKDELRVEEVNIYGEPDCGQVQLHCVTDCIIVGTAWINPDR